MKRWNEPSRVLTENDTWKPLSDAERVARKGTLAPGAMEVRDREATAGYRNGIRRPEQEGQPVRDGDWGQSPGD